MRECKKELEGMIDKTNSHPILIRLAWHDAGEPQNTNTKPLWDGPVLRDTV